MKYETIIWDWNGTLLDDVALSLRVVNGILRDHRLAEVTHEHYQQIFQFPVQRYYESAGMDFSRVSFESISARFCREFEEQIGSTELFPPVKTALAAIAAMGLRQLVLSSTEHAALERMVSGLQVADAFDDIRGLPDGLARGKVEVGRALIETHRINPRKAIMVGDTEHDWEVAQALGMHCLLVTTGHQSRDRLSSAGCPVLDSASDVVSYLNEEPPA